MKVSKINVVLTEEDLLSALHDFVEVEGLSFNNIEIKEVITLKGSYKKGITIPFSVLLGFGNVKDNVVVLKLLKVKLSKIGIMRGITNLAIRKFLGNFGDYGVNVNNDTISLNLDLLTKIIPFISFKLNSILLTPRALQVELSDMVYSADKKVEKVTVKEENKNIEKVEDQYSKVRKDMIKKVPNKYDKLIQYAMLIPDITALFIRLFKDKRVSIKTKATVGAVLTYLASPIDIFPDFIPFIGKIDDVALAFFALNSIINDVPEEIILQNWQGEDNIILIIREGVDYISKVVGTENVAKIVGFMKKSEKEHVKLEVAEESIKQIKESQEAIEEAAASEVNKTPKVKL